MVGPIERRITEVRLVYNVPGEIVRMALGWPQGLYDNNARAHPDYMICLKLW